jgi:hypothetical protein
MTFTKSRSGLRPAALVLATAGWAASAPPDSTSRH